MTSARRSAFFDADETVITAKSMFAFLRHWMAQNGDSGSGYDRAMADIRSLAADNVDRSEINRTYYRLFKGVSQQELVAAGRDWYDGYRNGPTAFVGATLDALDGHRAAGDLICLVSGSFRAVLEPLAEEIAAEIILCTEPVVGEDGLLTGEVHQPMIGAAKTAAVAGAIAAHRLSPADCYGYGDHLSDLGLLEQVGNPHVVDVDPALVALAKERGWPVLPSAPTALRQRD
ncbi:HAD-IB family hydrolase [Streptomyces sp. NBC_01210]|uniref:HAD family hydrolase n=1 Tax=Streptomyces sp. NBC_01210 TaxID=2903774 RepID=UPI002E158941|nr:HAD-IB family hydrolase [Streptomyces sp. NBC_01210]